MAMTFPFRNPRKEWLFLTIAMTVPFFASLVYFKWWSEHPAAQVVYFCTKLFTFLWPLLGGYLFLEVWIPELRLRDSMHRRALPFGALTGLLVVAIMMVGLSTSIGAVVLTHGPGIARKLEVMGVRNYYIPFALFLSILHSLLEEYYWRWFVYGNLRELIALPLASLLSALAFASHHVVILDEYFPTPWAFFFGASVAVGGVLWNFLYETQRTLAGAWVSHMIIDLGIMAIGYVLLWS